MLKQWRFPFLASTCVLLAGCSDDAVSPTRLRSPESVSAARASSSINASAISAVQVDLSWADNARGENGWEVHRSTNGATGAFTLLVSLGANVAAYSNTGLTGLKEYCYKVRSFSISGKKLQYAAFSSVACATTLGPPSAVNAVPRSSTSVDLTWADNADTESGFRIERAGTESGPWEPAKTLAANTVKFTDYSRTPDERVCYRVVAVYTGGDAPADSDCTAPPRMPTDVAAVADAQRITVSWTDASVAEDGYEVERSRGGIWSVLATLPANATSHIDTEVIADIRYTYSVRARRDGGYSQSSAWVTAAVPSGPPPSPGIGNAPDGSTVAKIFWPSVSVNTTTIRIERSRDGISGWEPVGSSSVFDDGFRDAGRTPEQQICHRAFASNSLGESGPSNVDCTTLLAQPTNLAFRANEDGTTTVSWTDNTQYEEGYLISVVTCYNGVDPCEYAFDAWLPPNSSEFAFSLNPGESISGVWACAREGCSDAAAWEESASAGTSSASPSS